MEGDERREKRGEREAWTASGRAGGRGGDKRNEKKRECEDHLSVELHTVLPVVDSTDSTMQVYGTTSHDKQGHECMK